MNYSLLTDSPFNTALLSPEGRAVYRIDTYLSSFTTTVKKVGGGQSEVEIGRVVWQSGRPGTAVVHGHEIYVNKSSFFSSYDFFFFVLIFRSRLIFPFRLGQEHSQH